MAEANSLLSLREAIARIDAAIAPLPDEEVALASSLGRRLARAAIADRPVPHIGRASCDGFAVRADQTFGAGPYSPLTFRLHRDATAFGVGCAVACLEGEPLPEGADAIVPLEEAEVVGEGIQLIDPVAPGDHVVPAGAHARAGTVLLDRGRAIEADHIGLLSVAGCARPAVFRQPRIGILATRHDANAAASPADQALVEALVARDGGVRASSVVILREADAVAQALIDYEADLLIVTSGSRVRPDDAAATGLAMAGDLHFHGVALAPGMATGFGLTRRRVPVFVLPAAPEQCLWAYEFLAGRAVRRLGGGEGAPPFAIRRVRTAAKIVSTIGMTEIHPVQLEPDGGARPLPAFAEAGLFSAARADGFVLIPEGSEGVGAGSWIDVYLRSGTLSARPQNDGTEPRT